GGNAGVLGKVVQADNMPVTIVGVTSSAFGGIQTATGTAPDITLPLALEPRLDDMKLLDKPTAWWLQVVGRLKPGVTAAQVEGSLDGLFQSTARTGWSAMLGSLSERERSSSRYRDRTAIPRLHVDSARHGIYDATSNDRQSLTLLSLVVAVLL